MNEAHQMCGSDEWRQAMREVILPWALGDTELGDDVLEVGPGYGACTDVLSQAVPKLRPGAPLVASDSLGSDELAAHHTDDTYHPVDPDSLADRLTAAGFTDVDVHTSPYGWAAFARMASA
jgi:hypothetical protein